MYKNNFCKKSVHLFDNEENMIFFIIEITKENSNEKFHRNNVFK